jgi:2-polyprenyl-6-methoxyphenol hydroxylase-like FAD-dependent oxidoreductase
VGINLAVQDAVATANILAAAMREGRELDLLLPFVQRRRMLPTRMVQAAQRMAHDRIIKPILTDRTPTTRAPRMLRLLRRFPALQRIPARLIGMGIRPEHIRSPQA